RKNTLSVIGNGVVIDPFALKREIDLVSQEGVHISAANLCIAENAPLILSVHQKVDMAAEAIRGKGKIGTTGRGIGPAYEDKVARRSVRVCDLADRDVLIEKIDNLLVYHNALLRAAGAPEVTRDEILAPLEEIAPFILSLAVPVWRLLDRLK